MRVVRPLLRRFFPLSLLLILLGFSDRPAWGQANSTNIISGSISVPGEVDTYTFNLTARSRFYFDTLTNNSDVQWSLEGPAGPLVDPRAFSSSDAGNATVLSLDPGFYQLYVDGSGETTNGYRFRFVNLSSAPLLTPDVVVSNTLALGNETHFYQFAAAAGDQYWFRRLFKEATGNIWFRLLDPYNRELFSHGFGDEPTFTLPATGTYVVLVEGYASNDNPVTYSFLPDFLGNTPPAPFTGTPYTLGQVIAGQLVDTSTNEYRFTLGTETRVIFDSLTNSPSVQVLLEGPGGTIINNVNLNSIDWQNSTHPQRLPAGDYHLQLRRTAAGAMPYRLRLLTDASGTTITPGTPVQDRLEQRNSTKIYRFAASAGTRVFLDMASTNSLPSAGWRLYDPLNNLLQNAGITTDRGPFTLRLTGTYTLLIEGYYAEESGDPGFRFDIVPVTDGLQTIGLGDLVNSQIQTPGQTQRFVFSVPTERLIYLDSRTNAPLRLWLEGPEGNLINNVGFTGLDASSPHAGRLARAGDYTLRVAGAGEATGGFAFRLLDLSTAQFIALNSPVSGALTPANETDAYRFTAAAGTRVFFDSVASSGLPNAYWRCLDDRGQVILSTSLSDVANVLLTAGGTYTLLIEGYHSDLGIGNYTFNLVSVADESRPLALNTVAQGNINAPGQAHAYSFNLSEQTFVLFDALNANSDIRWSLDGPAGTLVNNRSLSSSDGSSGQAPLKLASGSYVLTVRSTTDTTGAYAFRLLDLAAAEIIPIDTQLTRTLDPANESDPMRFTVSPGSKLYFDFLNQTGLPNAYWRCYNPRGEQVFSSSLGDQGPFVFAEGGIYTLSVEGYQFEVGSGNYSLRIHTVADQAAPLSLGTVVTGSLVKPGQLHTYSFSLGTPSRLYLDSLTDNSSLRWSLRAPGRDWVSNLALTSSDGPNNSDPLLNLTPGDYRLTIDGSGDSTGAYSFRLLDLSVGNNLVPGTTVSANLSPGNRTEVYRFTVTPGDRYALDWISQANLPNLYWRLYDPTDSILFRSYVGDIATNRFLIGGTYTLLVEGYYGDLSAGAYQFRLVPGGNVPPTPYTGTGLTLGATINGALATATSSNLYAFTLPSRTQLYFDALVNSGVNWTLEGPAGVLVNSRAFWSSDSAFIGDSTVDCAAGHYRLTVFGTAGAYAFRLVDSASATPMNIGSPVAGTVSPANGTGLLKFTATAGDRFYLDGGTRSGFATSPTLRIMTPTGRILLSDNVTSDAEDLTAPETGLYLVSVEGRPAETATSGDYSFTLQPVLDSTNSMFVGETIQGSISLPGRRHHYELSLSAPATLFFDSLSNNGLLWSLRGPNGLIITDRAFWSSDSADANSLLNLPAGEYAITVRASGGSTGDYSFRLLDSSSAFPISVGSEATGNLAPGLSTRLYRFTASAGDRLYFDGRPTTGFTANPYLRLFSPLGNLLMNSHGITSDLELDPLPQTGSYLLAVEGRYSDTSTNGSFSLLFRRSLDVTNSFSLGARVEGSLTVPGERHYLKFSLAQPTLVFFDTLSDSSLTVTLTGPQGLVFDSRALYSTDSADGNPALDLPAGNFVITIDPSAAILGSYAFRLIDAATAIPMTPGTPVTGSLTPGVSTLLYRFSSQAGARFYYDGLPTSGFTAGPYSRVYFASGKILFDAQTTSGDRDLILPQSGDYLFTVEGRYSDTSAQGNFSFNLVPNPTQPPRSLFDTNVAPDLTVTGVGVTPSANLQSGQNIAVRWTTRNSGTAGIAGSFTEQVTLRNAGNGQVVASRTLAYDSSVEGSLNPTQSRERNLSIQIPDGPGSVGTLQVTVTTDTLNQVIEQNEAGTAEANNAASLNTTVTLAPYPDLQITGLSVTPLSGWTNGQHVTLNWVTTNSGNRATAGSWVEGVRIRNTNTSALILSTALPYDESGDGQGPIAPSSARSRSLSFTVPPDASAFGAFEITVTADDLQEVFEHNAGNTAEQNNSATLRSSSAPDLAITGLQAIGNPSLQAGAELLIRWNTTNRGNTLAVGAFYERVFVRNTNTAEVLLNTLVPYTPTISGNGDISPATFRAREQSYRIPEGTRGVGGLEITVTVDALSQLVEHNPQGNAEANNDTVLRITVAGRPYPDLVVTSVTAPGNAQTGQQIPVIWTVRNQSSVAATNGWSDHLFLSTDAALGNDTFLTSLAFSGILNAGQSLTRTQQVTLPAFGTGSRYFAVETDAGNQVFEENEGNNVGFTPQPTSVPAALALNLNTTSISENAGNQAVQATVVRNSDTASALTVTLGNNQPTRLTLPASVTLPIGAASANFFVQLPDDNVALGDFTATFTVQAPGHNPATNRLTVIDNDSPTLALQLSAASVSEGAAAGTLTGTVTRNAQTNLALTISLVSDRPGTLTPPATVTLAPGQTSARLNLSPIDDDLVTGNRVVSLFASASGYTPVSTSVTVVDNDTVALTLQLSDQTVSEAAINPASIATLTRTPVSSALLRVQLSTNSGNLVQIPAEVIIPANQPGVTFPVNVRNDLLAYGAQNVTLVAQALGADGSPLAGARANASIRVTEDDGPTLGISFQNAVIEEGASTLASISRNTPPTNSLTVSLSALPSGQTTFPASVVIPIGATSTNIVVRGVTDGVSDGLTEVVFTATAANYNPGTGPLTVTDVDIPDLMVVEATVPPTSLTDGLISAIWSVTNSGLANAVGSWIDEVYLSTDAQGANVSLLASVTNQGPLLLGEGYSRSRSFFAPSDPGKYWVLVRTDALRGIAEGSERNNVLISGPIEVQPAYRATASTDVDSALSGTPIPIKGRTFFTSDGSPAPFRTATVRINVNQVRRLLSVVSDAQGNFSTTFQPISGEAGVYTLGADHPRVREDQSQDQFTLLGMAAVPWQVTLRLTPNEAATGKIEVRNLSPLPLTGLQVSGEGVPLGFELAASLAGSLAGNQTSELQFSLRTTLTTGASGRLGLVVTSAEGATLRIPIEFTIAPPTAELVAEPTSLRRGMLRGTQTLVQFEVLNRGGVASGDLTVALPVVPWLSLVSESPIPSLAPGARTTIVLALNPAANLPLTVYNGSLTVIGTQPVNVTVPFEFRAVSEARGDLLITATDEHTYFVSGAPKLANATIVLRDPFTNGIVAQGITDASGEFRFSNLLEGDYQLEATAPEHTSLRGGVRVTAGTTKEQEVFLSQKTVRYEWRVVPTTVEDHYRVVLEPKFETEVPQPNLVVENPLIMPLVTPGRVSQFEIRLRNTGLIALQRVRIPVPSNPKLIITPLVTELEELPAQTSISVPVTIRLADTPPPGAPALQGVGLAATGACEGTECVVHMPIDTRFRCGQNFVFRQEDVVLRVVCVPDTGCQFPTVDITRVDFMTANQIAFNAEFECLLGHMDECQKARVRGYLRSGDFGSLDGPFGSNDNPSGFGISDFCGCGPAERIPQIFNAASNYMASLGFSPTSVAPGVVNFGTVDLLSEIPCNRPPPPVPSLQGDVPPPPGAAVCAKVRIELSQDITLTRAAFRGTLVLENNSGSALTDIQLSLDFRDSGNQSAAQLFAIRGPTLSGLTGVDGSGVLANGATGSAEYTFIPTLEAAPTQPTGYYVGGILRFKEDGQLVTIQLLPGEITVLPEARLTLEYFQQRDVYSDDPFTPELEPAEPFALGLRVRNTGAGTARNFRIASAQPKIIENEKGLQIDFKLLGSRIDNQPADPNLNLALGQIDPGASRTVIWDFTSTLQGKFIDYRASFEHVDALGGKSLSLIESVKLHELIHVVQDERAGSDALPDFLVNDAPDADNLPDQVYLSNGLNEAVELATNPVVDGPATPTDLSVRLTATVKAGWNYLRLPNPGADFRLVSAVRSDGKTLRLGQNIWTTDRTFPSAQAGAVREKTLHLFDLGGTGIYTLNFLPIAVDSNAPASSITQLPVASPARFPLEWSGDDGVGGSGIAFFDIFVSVNSGPFTNWLARTTLRSAIFEGVNGVSYAFYSRATDVAGNVEVAPTSPDTQTTASNSNSAPTFVPVGELTLNEGNPFNFQVTAFDADVPRQTLTYALLSGPPSSSLNSATGIILWQSSESDGGTTNRFLVSVSDNGQPSLTATQTLILVVREINQAPVFAAGSLELEASEGIAFQRIIAATDPDLPTQTLRWQLEPGFPVGMSINASTGALNWTPGENDGPGEFPITVTVRDNGTPSLAASRTFRLTVREVNQAPTLAPIPLQAALVQTTLTVTNSATDPDRPAQEFFYSLGAGAPRGARIDRRTGVFTWTPSTQYAHSTNLVTIQVTDNGAPSLTASQTFRIIVGDYLEVKLGRGIAPAGQLASVPLVVFTTIPATNVVFTFEAPSPLLGSFSLSTPSAPIGFANLQSLGNFRYRVQLGTSAGASLIGERTVSQLNFLAAANGRSTFIPLVPITVTAVQVNGAPLAQAFGQPGRVVYLGREPLVELQSSPDGADLTVYGTGDTYTIESTPILGPGAQWKPYFEGVLIDLQDLIPVKATEKAQFFRAIQVP